MKTALYSKHVALGAKIIDFSGWEMPLHYTGILAEHAAVRNQVGVFDVSHMGVVIIKGKDAEPFLEYLCTNSILHKPDLSATYTVLCDERGGCVDDTIVFKISPQHFFLVTNAANRQKDLQHIQNISKAFNVKVTDRFQEDGILAVQGPLAEPLIRDVFGDQEASLKPMRLMETQFEGVKLMLSRTGYTGSCGFEIYAPNQILLSLWEALFEKGKKYQIKPVGLGARDTLRLEMAYALYGHEINESIAPTESVSAWTVKWQKEDFLGKQALLELETAGKKRAEQGIVLLEGGVVREGAQVFNQQGKQIGTVTSGNHSPTMNKSIAIILVDEPLAIGDQVQVKIRDRLVQAGVVDFPFIKVKQ